MTYLTIQCLVCRCQTGAAKLRDAQGNWVNVCQPCKTRYPSLPPGARDQRQRRRMYEKRSGQLLLGGASR